MDNNESPQTISITGVMIEDASTGGFTAYFAEFPEVIAQGSNKEVAKQNLMRALKDMLEFKKSEIEDEDEDGVTTEPFNLYLS
jgi:predicted RNase H-like HicB family nuclease